MSDQQIDPVDNEEGEGEGRKEERRKGERRQGDDVEYLKHEENRRREDRRHAGGGKTIEQTLTGMLDKGPDMDRIIKIVFTRVLFIIAMAIILYHVAAYFIFPNKLFKGDFKDFKKVEDVNR